MRGKRYALIDALRGLALLNMLGMHFLYDVNVVFGREPGWILRPGIHIWQQYICWSFILIAGFAFPWGREKNLRRGLLLNAWGFAVTAVTLLFLPEEAIWFGILNFLGCAILLTIPLERGMKKLPPLLALALFFLLFLLFRYVDSGVLALGGLFRLQLPKALYRFRFLAPLGFPDAGFRSSDYFPMLPWFFLFLCGHALHRIVMARPALRRLARTEVPLLSAVGRRTLLVYLLHQPILYGICLLLFG